MIFWGEKCVTGFLVYTKTAIKDIDLYFRHYKIYSASPTWLQDCVYTVLQNGSCIIITFVCSHRASTWMYIRWPLYMVILHWCLWKIQVHHILLVYVQHTSSILSIFLTWNLKKWFSFIVQKHGWEIRNVFLKHFYILNNLQRDCKRK